MTRGRPKAVTDMQRFAERASDASAVDAQVTSMRPAGPRGARFAITVESEPIGEVPALAIVDARVSVGDAWTPERARRVIDAGWRHLAYACLLRLIAARGRSRIAYQRALAQRGYPAQAAEHALERGEQAGLIDDDAALRAALDREFRAARGVRAIVPRLRALGFPTDHINHAIRSHDDRPDERETARALADRWARSRGQRLEPDVARRRLAGYLARRGFDGAVCRAAVDEALGAGSSRSRRG